MSSNSSRIWTSRSRQGKAGIAHKHCGARLSSVCWFLLVLILSHFYLFVDSFVPTHLSFVLSFLLCSSYSLSPELVYIFLFPPFSPSGFRLGGSRRVFGSSQGALPRLPVYYLVQRRLLSKYDCCFLPVVHSVLVASAPCCVGDGEYKILLAETVLSVSYKSSVQRYPSYVTSRVQWLHSPRESPLSFSLSLSYGRLLRIWPAGQRMENPSTGTCPNLFFKTSLFITCVWGFLFIIGKMAQFRWPCPLEWCTASHVFVVGPQNARSGSDPRQSIFSGRMVAEMGGPSEHY